MTEIPIDYSSSKTRLLRLNAFFVAAIALFLTQVTAISTVIPAVTQPLAKFPFGVSAFAVDPVRSKIYATAVSTDEVYVLNTNTLKVEKTLAVGPSPTGLAISVDNSKLYVVNSEAEYLSVFDLDTLKPLPTLSLPGIRAFDIEFGLDNRLYVSSHRSYPLLGPLFVVDSSTGEVLHGFGFDHIGATFWRLEISPDKKTLFMGAVDLDGGTVAKADVSREKPIWLQTVFGLEGSKGMVLSHDGDFLCYAQVALSTVDLRVVRKTFGFPGGEPEHPYYGPIALNQDSSISYQTNHDLTTSIAMVTLRSTKSLRFLSSIIVSEGARWSAAPIAISTDRTDRYLFVSQHAELRVYDVSPRLESDTLTVVQGAALSYQVKSTFIATNCTATSLPPGLVISNEGRISGTPTSAGTFVTTVRATTGGTTVTCDLTFKIDGIRLKNISTRAFSQPYEKALVGGFVIEGTVEKTVVIRVLGKSLSGDGLPGFIDPAFSLRDATGRQIGYNNDWGFRVNRLRSLGLAPSDPREAAGVATLNPGAYTVVVEGGGGGLINGHVGVALFEVYDIDDNPASRLANVSSRANILPSDLVAVAGVIAVGAGEQKVLFRALGPSLAGAGVESPLRDPVLELHDGDGTLLAKNDNWKQNQQREIEATGIPPSEDAEAAILVGLPRGAFTAVLNGKGLSGIALIEAYHLRD
ncbi:MAG: putative Ig domain-containing protein [Blastocatellia bacterium]|nr:putative Ig domain-containing protein [Blastocatellia bacterium]